MHNISIRQCCKYHERKVQTVEGAALHAHADVAAAVLSNELHISWHHLDEDMLHEPCYMIFK